MVQSLKRMRYFTDSQWGKFRRGLDLLNMKTRRFTDYTHVPDNFAPAAIFQCPYRADCTEGNGNSQDDW